MKQFFQIKKLLSYLMKFKKIHRRYPDTGWDFKAIELVLEAGQTAYVFNHLNNKGKFTKSLEVFKGDNYFGNGQRSWSRHYDYDKIPKTLMDILKLLETKHEETEWDDTSEYLNEN